MVKSKNALECLRTPSCSGFFQTMLLYISMKNYKNIGCGDFVNINIALNSHAYEENYSFIKEFMKNICFVAL